MALRILLVRHGQTDWNAQRRLQGSTNVPLNAHGRWQGAELARRLGGLRVEHVYTSCLRRSLATAEGFEGLAPITAVAALDEQSLGIFEGRYLDGREPAIVDAYFRRLASLDDHLDGGESVNEHLSRVSAGLDFILERHRRTRGDLLIIGHGASNVAILRRLFGLSYQEGRALRPANGELFIIEFSATGLASLWRRGGLPPAALNESTR
jgi:2,3-bisphosphoglycerate-dependent phosphoglycerate mutase